MCGINGIYCYGAGASVDRQELMRSRDAMAPRGPDGEGEWISQDGRAGSGHRRLSIIDLTVGGAQPMTSADGKLTVSFNGEIYNYLALRRSLEAKGYVFKSQSDTEVLLHLYAAKGEQMLHDLRGMFAFAIFDGVRDRMLLARDPYGIKPLYYAAGGGAVRFASQVKALLAGGAVSRAADPAGLVGFYLFGSVPEPFTTYRSIRALPAGSYVFVKADGVLPPVRYHSLASRFCEAERAPHDAGRSQEIVRDALLDSMRHHMVADVPVGVFLSSGIDSCALAGLMRDASQGDLKSVTVAFEEFRGCHEDEAPLARRVADRYGFTHTTRVVTEAEFRADLPRILDAMDQPSIDGLNTWFVSKAAREIGLKVAISGLGGDELFGGYPSFQDIPKWVARLSLPSRLPFAGKFARRLLSQVALQNFGTNPKLAGILELGGSVPGAYLLRRGLFMPWELEQILGSETAREGLCALAPVDLIDSELRPLPSSSFARVAVLESSLYMRNQLLRDADWASMAHGLEIRLPLVDTTLLKSVSPVMLAGDGHRGKWLLAQSPSVCLPSSVTARRKSGFTTPIAQWLDRAPPTRGATRPPLASGEAPWARRWAWSIGAAAFS